ncbi:serine/threonine-protein kinase [Streptomonospora wellingtoniae]|uniref:Serine/threonine-protein kinase n=1 Tax=Streptomonospora wellingtoniae TaxID=3075544 RepID=A0ABU2KRB3_9ACTN|nr:serine/threonine-protein kinase [Streptomonospora sp. DSM 45055]MDT0301809.1 serine/threonine-protein kinase [Streptomonospora sp. DSM 45055]
MTSPLRPEDPERIGPYTLIAQIGRGGQGVVYLGTGPDGERTAVKVLSGEWAAADHRVRAGLAKEVEATRRVAAFCTAAVRSFDLDSDPPYVASEYIEGPTLRQAVRRDGPHRGSALDRLAIASATALVAIHEAGVVHRDLKPANVLLGPDGPRVIDFGIARSTDATLTQAGSISGTPAYMAPEQIRGRALEPATDVFAWAGVMVYAATGTTPFASDGTVHDTIHNVLHEPPRLDGVAERLRPLLAVCLDKDPGRRPTAVQALSTLIGRDPAALDSAAVTAVLHDGYSAATEARPRVADTATFVALPGAAGAAGADAGAGSAFGARDGDPAAAGGTAEAPGPGGPRSGAGAAESERGSTAADPARREPAGPGTGAADGGLRAPEGADSGYRYTAGPAAGGYREPAGGGSGPPPGPPAAGGRGALGGGRGRGRRRAEWGVAAALLLLALGLAGWLAWDSVPGPGNANPAREEVPDATASESPSPDAQQSQEGPAEGWDGTEQATPPPATGDPGYETDTPHTWTPEPTDDHSPEPRSEPDDDTDEGEETGGESEGGDDGTAEAPTGP